ncbi:hypothetical protein [Marinoscillum sp.]|uniref:hypothetical protein n=1 Tax=Marinoscillum sp. TaxID=2024838 RepID=UPI003BACEFCA
MYRGFNLTLDDYNEINYNVGRTIFDSHQSKIKKGLEHFIDNDGSIDGQQLSEEWFPKIQANLFISHSHNDEKKALSLSGWLYQKFGLTSFIDSSVWGYSNDLLKIIDNAYCKTGEYYSYEKRNYSTSHIHMMLSAAITRMIDSCECLFFLNTPSSMKASSTISGRTNSPWIYSELVTSKLIRKRPLLHYRPDLIKAVFESREFSEGLGSIMHKAPLDHLTDLNKSDLSNWVKGCGEITHDDQYPLDVLYSIKPQKK